MHTLLDRNDFSFRSNDQVAAHRVTGLIIKRLWPDLRQVWPAAMYYYNIINIDLRQ